MLRTKICCEICGKEISRSNYKKHLCGHQNHPERYTAAYGRYKLNHDGLICQFCGKECKNRNSLCNHERLCSKNPDGQENIHQGFNNIGKESWNRGLTKETDERIAKSVNTYNENELAGKHTNHGHTKHTEEFKEKQRARALSRGLGGFHTRRGIYYNGIKLDSSYEVLVAESLDINNIKWERPGRFLYHFNGQPHYYTPDFYLPDYDIYLDPKNDYLINNINPRLGYFDIDKVNVVMQENSIRIIILDKNQLDWEVIKTLI